MITLLATVAGPMVLKMLMRWFSPVTAENVVGNKLFGWGVFAVLAVLLTGVGYTGFKVWLWAHDREIRAVLIAEERARRLELQLGSEREARRQNDEQLKERADWQAKSDSLIAELNATLERLRNGSKTPNRLLFRADDPWLLEHRRAAGGGKPRAGGR